MDVNTVKEIFASLDENESATIVLKSGDRYIVEIADIDYSDAVMTIYPSDDSMHYIAYNAIVEIFLETY